MTVLATVVTWLIAVLLATGADSAFLAARDESRALGRIQWPFLAMSAVLWLAAAWVVLQHHGWVPVLAK